MSVLLDDLQVSRRKFTVDDCHSGEQIAPEALPDVEFSADELLAE